MADLNYSIEFQTDTGQVTAAGREVERLTGNLQNIRTGTEGLNDLNQLIHAIEQAGGNTTSLRAEFTQLSNTFNSLPLAEQNRQIQLLGNSAVDLTRHINSTTSQMERLFGVRTSNTINGEIAQINASLATLRQRLDAGTISQEEFNRMSQAGQARLNSLQSELNQTTSSMNQMGNATAQAGGGVDKLAGTLRNMAGAYVGIDAVRSGIEALVETSKEMDSLAQKLEYATGSAKEAGETFNYLKDISNELGLNYMDMSNGYAQLASATKNLNMSTQDTRTAFEGVARASAAMSLTQEESNGVMLALSQIASKGKVSMEELRGQLGERLTPAFGIAAQAMGVTTSELEKMVESGINAKEFLPKFGAALTQSFNEQAANNINTTTGALNLLTNKMTDLKAQVLDVFADDSISSGLQMFSDGIDYVSNAIDNLDPQSIEAVKQVFVSIFEVIGTIGTQLQQVYNDFNTTFSSMTAIFGETDESVGFITRTMQGLSIVIAAVSDALNDVALVSNFLRGGMAAFLSESMQGWSKLLGELAKIKLLPEGMRQAFAGISQNLDEASQKMQKASDDSFQAMEKNIENQGQATQKALNATIVTSDQLADRAEKAAERAAESFSKLATKGKASGEDLAKGFSEAVDKATKPEQVDELVGKYGELAREGKITGEQLAEGMNKAKIKSEELDKSVGRQIPTMAELAKAGENTATDIKTRMSDTAQALGLNFDKASLGISESFRKTSAAVMDVGNNFDELKAQGYDASSLLVQGLDKLLASANNQKEIDTVRQMYVDFGKDGKLSAEQVEDGIEGINEKLSKTPELMDATSRAFKALGIISREEAEKQAKEAIANYEIVKNSGQASAQQLQEALDKVNKKIEVSGNASQQSWLDSQKSALGVKDAVEKTTGSTERLTRSASSVGTAYQNAARLSVQELEEISKRLDFLNTKNKELQAKWAKDSAARDESNRATTAKSMQSVANYSTLTAMENFLKSAGLSDKQAMDQAQSLMNRYGKNGRMNWTAANGLTEGAALTTQQMANYKDPTAYLLDIAEKIRYNQAALDRQTAIVEQNKQASANRTVNVNLNFDGQSLPMTIDADKEQLFNDFINRLQSDSKRQAR